MKMTTRFARNVKAVNELFNNDFSQFFQHCEYLSKNSCSDKVRLMGAQEAYLMYIEELFLDKVYDPENYIGDADSVIRLETTEDRISFLQCMQALGVDLMMTDEIKQGYFDEINDYISKDKPWNIINTIFSPQEIAKNLDDLLIEDGEGLFPAKALVGCLAFSPRQFRRLKRAGLTIKDLIEACSDPHLAAIDIEFVADNYAVLIGEEFLFTTSSRVFAAWCAHCADLTRGGDMSVARIINLINREIRRNKSYHYYQLMTEDANVQWMLREIEAQSRNQNR